MQTSTYRVPSDTQRVLTNHFDKCSNMRLILARYIPREAIDSKTPGEQNNRKSWRSEWLTEICTRTSEKNYQPLVDATFNRWVAINQRAKTKGFVETLQSPLVVGLGGKNPLEFGITLHHVTGLPYIPGSALKGVTRAYTLLLIAEQLQIPVLQGPAFLRMKERKPPKETPLEALDTLLSVVELQSQQEALAALNKALRDPDLGDQRLEKQFSLEEIVDRSDATQFRTMFGSTESSGQIVFGDGVVKVLPKDGTLFRVDVMTPHFPKYYGSEGGASPSDDDSPNPVLFLTVATGTAFGFAVCGRSDSVADDVSSAMNLLREALDIMGIGAKTAAGYGVFQSQR